MDATSAHSTQVLPATVTAGPADRHSHHVLAMQTPCTGLTMAHHPTVGAQPPHTDGPCYSGRAAVATHVLRAVPSGYARHGDMAAQYPGTVAYPPRGFPHQTPHRHLPGTVETPQHDATGGCLPHQTPLHTRSPRDTSHLVDYVPPKTGVSTPIYTQLPHTSAGKEPRLCTDECGGDRDYPPGDRSLRRPPDQACCHHTLGHHGGGSMCQRISTDVPVPHAPARRPEHPHICGRLRHNGPHTGRWGSCGTTPRRNGPTAETPPDSNHHFWGFLARRAEDTSNL